MGFTSMGNRAYLTKRINAARARESEIEGTLRSRRRVMKFNPDSEYIRKAMLDFFKRGGSITRLKPGDLCDFRDI